MVTGASRGLGRAIALELARDGLLVIVNFRSDAEGAAQTQEAINALGGRCQIAQFDVSDASAVRTAVRNIDRDIGRINVLVNNAASGVLKPLARVKPSDIEQSLQVNLAGVLHCTCEVVKTWSGGVLEIALSILPVRRLRLVLPVQ